MEFFKEILGKIWYILYPFLFYYAVMLIIMTIAQWAFGGDATHYVFCQLIATVFTIPSMLPFYRQGQALAGIAKQPFGISRERICHALFAAGIMACFGISLNNLISMTKLTEISMGYQQANTDFTAVQWEWKFFVWQCLPRFWKNWYSGGFFLED